MSSQEISLESISNDVTSIRNKINELDLSNDEKTRLESIQNNINIINSKINIYSLDYIYMFFTSITTIKSTGTYIKKNTENILSLDDSNKYTDFIEDIKLIKEFFEMYKSV